MSMTLRVASPEEMERAAEIHFECLPGNNDDRAGGGWIPLEATDCPREVVIVAIEEAQVIGYAWGDENTDGIAVCQEVAVMPDRRRRGYGEALVRAFASHAASAWSSKWVYLLPLDQPELVAFYRRLGFKSSAKESGYLRARADRLGRGR